MKITNYKLVTILIVFFVLLLNMFLFAKAFKVFFAIILIGYCVVLFFSVKTLVISLIIDDSSFKEIFKIGYKKSEYDFLSIKKIVISNNVRFTEFSFNMGVN